MPNIIAAEIAPLLISLASAAIAILSLTFAVYSWRQAHRPLVTARITTAKGGSMGISLSLLVENTGNRPARDVRLVASEPDVRAALRSLSGELPVEVQRCFFKQLAIPVLANGRSTSSAFWHLGQEDSWNAGAEIPIKVVYRDLGSRRFSNGVRLLLADDAGFTQVFWESSTGNKI